MELETLVDACKQMLRSPGTLRHVFLRSDKALAVDELYSLPPDQTFNVTTPEDANLISSRIDGTSMHAPVLDIDFPCTVVPSSTPGHYHLYLDKPMSWSTYRALLRAMSHAGVLQAGFVECSIELGESAVRPPWVKK
jgi:hypothetical protein